MIVEAGHLRVYSLRLRKTYCRDLHRQRVDISIVVYSYISHIEPMSVEVGRIDRLLFPRVLSRRGEMRVVAQLSFLRPVLSDVSASAVALKSDGNGIMRKSAQSNCRLK